MAGFDKDKALQIMLNGSDDEKRALVEELALTLKHRPCGLVWGRGGTTSSSPFEAENVVLEVADGIPYPVYREDLSTNPDKSNGNMLLEGDNYVWLKLLEETHRGMIDVIYIDPPYNTGRKKGDSGFKYNDRFIDENSSYYASKWLDVMEKRLKLARTLLTSSGILFISIGQEMVSELALLCKQVFGRKSVLPIITMVNNPSGRSDSGLLATSTEFIITCVKSPDKAKMPGVMITDSQLSEYKQQDEWGAYKTSQLKKTGKNSRRIDRPNMYYPIYYNETNQTFELQRTSPDDIEIFPPDNGDGSEGCWRWGKGPEDKFPTHNTSQFLLAKKTKRGWNIYVKDRPVSTDGVKRFVKPKTHWMEKEYTTTSAVEFFKAMGFATDDFNAPKSVPLIKYMLSIIDNKDAVVLDFFAGSGTTAHAVEQLNEEDGGHRQWILITNNESEEGDDTDSESGICQDITKPRLDTVITGKRIDGTSYSEGTDSGYEYFQYKFIPRDKHRYERNAYKFFQPYIVDAMIMVKYGVHKIATDEQRMACVYENNTMKILSFFADSTPEQVQETIDEYVQAGEEKSILLLLSDGNSYYNIIKSEQSKKGIDTKYQHSLVPDAGYLE